MRVLVLTSSFPDSQESGVCGYVYDLARRLAEDHSHEVRVLAPAGRDESLPFASIDVQRFQHPWVGTRKLRANTDIGAAVGVGVARFEALSFSATFAANALSAASKADVILSHWLLPAGIAGALASRARTPHVAVAHGGDVHMLGRMVAGKRLARYIAARADRIVFVSEQLSSLFMKISGTDALGEKGAVVPMGAEIGTGLQPARSKESDRIVVLFLGRLHPIKGVDLLLDAAAKIPNLEVQVAGDGPELAALRSRAELSRLPVSFLGEVDRMQRRKLLEECDVVVIPSRIEPSGRCEGAPVACAEALVAGRPVIASNSGGISELVESEVSGLLIEPGNSAALTEALARFAADASLRARLAEGAREAGRTRTMARTAQAFDAILRAATEERRSL